MVRDCNTCRAVLDTWIQSNNTCRAVLDTWIQSNNICRAVLDTWIQSNNTCRVVLNTWIQSNNICRAVLDTLIQSNNQFFFIFFYIYRLNPKKRGVLGGRGRQYFKIRYFSDPNLKMIFNIIYYF